MTLESYIRGNEGVRQHPYRDTKGKLTIGVGRNLDDVGLSPGEIEYLFSTDRTRAIAAVDHLLPSQCPPSGSPRYWALVDMAFTLGYAGLRDFSGMLSAVRRSDWDRAALEVLWIDPDAKPRRPTPWYEQARARASRAAYMLRHDEVARVGEPDRS